MIEIGPLRAADRETWEVLARGYKAFYRDPQPDEALPHGGGIGGIRVMKAALRQRGRPCG